MPKILITGKKGYIASSLNSSLKEDYEVYAVGRDELDWSNTADVNQWFKKKQFDVVIHTAIQGGHRLHNDDVSVLDINLKMYYNLLAHSDKYARFINIGSGAELFNTNFPYGLSKYVIKQSITNKENFHNLRVFAVFDENELPTRFIKANILRYINKENMIIFSNKRMDFFYMKDFIKIIRKYIEDNNLPKDISCTYEQTYYLSEISNFINTLDSYKVKIDIQSDSYGIDYCGNYDNIYVKFDGLFNGIQSVYEKLSCKK